MIARAAEIALYVGLPVALLLLRRAPVVRTVGPVILAYAAGLALGNQGLLPLDRDFALAVSSVAVALAIPLLLFSVDVIAWVRLARATVLSFGLAVIGVLVSAMIVPRVLAGIVPDSSRIAGMLTGVYIGGTINMVSIGAALGVPPRTFVMLNAADMVASTIHLLFMVTAAQRPLGTFLPAFPARRESGEETAAEPPRGRAAVLAVLACIGLSALVVGLSAGTGMLVSGPLRDIVIIVAITSVALAFSFVPRIRALPLTYETGLFFILVFCVSVVAASLKKKQCASSPEALDMTLAFLTTAVVVHVALAALFRVDRDTVIVTSAAAIWAPPIIPPVTAAIRNRELLGPGIACGLVGYAVGNYLGLAVSWILS